MYYFIYTQRHKNHAYIALVNTVHNKTGNHGILNVCGFWDIEEAIMT